eukprot:TRINITY_DN28543_c0_g1_i1.p1 TRINITY_DN28543_c0_g1~~TRINITY_DN28543_c0_g1_i1.p1  ORF type:complete len:519 (+),score=263.13 TRINITY_DN28543_c0_g1_i1:48-1604(+)
MADVDILGCVASIRSALVKHRFDSETLQSECARLEKRVGELERAESDSKDVDRDVIEAAVSAERQRAVIDCDERRRAEVAAAEGERDTARRLLADKDQSLAAASLQLAQAAEARAAAEKRLHLLSVELRQLHERERQHHDREQSLRLQMDKFAAGVKELEQRSAEATAKQRRLESEMRRLAAVTDENRRFAAAAQAQLAETTEDMKRLHLTIGREREEASSARLGSEKARAEVTAMEQQLQTKSDQMEGLRAAMREAEDMRQKAEQQLSDTLRRLAAAEGDVQDAVRLRMELSAVRLSPAKQPRDRLRCSVRCVLCEARAGSHTTAAVEAEVREARVMAAEEGAAGSRREAERLREQLEALQQELVTRSEAGAAAAPDAEPPQESVAALARTNQELATSLQQQRALTERLERTLRAQADARSVLVGRLRAAEAAAAAASEQASKGGGGSVQRQRPPPESAPPADRRVSFGTPTKAAALPMKGGDDATPVSDTQQRDEMLLESLHRRYDTKRRRLSKPF